MLATSRLIALSFVLLTGFLAAPIGHNVGHADELLWADRVDSRVPEKCRDPKIADYGAVERLVFYGSQGAVAKGFTHEIDLERNEATTLWSAIKSDRRPSGSLGKLWDFLNEHGKEAMGFDFQKEGDVLEALSLSDLERDYPTSQYYTTGGVSYHNRASAGKFETVGELDVIIARKSDCAVIAIGEAKLGLKSLRHARAQVSRFVSYAKAKLCQGGNGPAICQKTPTE